MTAAALAHNPRPVPLSKPELTSLLLALHGHERALSALRQTIWSAYPIRTQIGQLLGDTFYEAVSVGFLLEQFANLQDPLKKKPIGGAQGSDYPLSPQGEALVNLRVTRPSDGRTCPLSPETYEAVVNFLQLQQDLYRKALDQLSLIRGFPDYSRCKVDQAIERTLMILAILKAEPRVTRREHYRPAHSSTSR